MKIVFHGTNPAYFRPGFEALLSQPHEILTLSDALDGPEERAHFATADVIIGNRFNANDPVPSKVRLFHAPAAGTDGIDAKLLPAGVALCNCFGHEQPIAEYVMAALLARHVPLADADTRLRGGDWAYWGGRPGSMRTELGDQTIGLLGFGHIGKAIAARAKAFGMRVSVCNRTKVPVGEGVDQSFTLDQITAFMGSADAIVVSLPMLESTKGIVNAVALGAMRPDGVIINVGRGPVIDEKALYTALSGKSIGGAIIDTWYVYPSAGVPAPHPSSLPFHELSNVVMTPHMSGWTTGTVRRRQETMAANIERLIRNEPLVNVVR